VDSKEEHGTMMPLPWTLDIPCWVLDVEEKTLIDPQLERSS
jgi:hypothetical protein